MRLHIDTNILKFYAISIYAYHFFKDNESNIAIIKTERERKRAIQ